LVTLLICTIVAVMIALGMLGGYKALFEASREIRKQDEQGIIEPTWLELKWRKMERKSLEQLKPYEEQVSLDHVMRFVTEAEEGEDASRGKLEIMVYPGGLVIGRWSGKYRIEAENIDHEVMLAKFVGLPDPDDVYREGETEDPTRLFIIARGKFSLIETCDDSEKKEHVVGEIYVTGWLDKDYSAKGQLHLLSKDMRHWAYKWRCEMAECVE